VFAPAFRDILFTVNCLTVSDAGNTQSEITEPLTTKVLFFCPYGVAYPIVILYLPACSTFTLNVTASPAVSKPSTPAPLEKIVPVFTSVPVNVAFSASYLTGVAVVSALAATRGI